MDVIGGGEIKKMTTEPISRASASLGVSLGKEESKTTSSIPFPGVQWMKLLISVNQLTLF